MDLEGKVAICRDAPRRKPPGSVRFWKHMGGEEEAEEEQKVEEEEEEEEW